MPLFSFAEKFELGAIIVVPALIGWLAPWSGIRLELGELIAGGALLILIQGFFRDLWLLSEARRKPATTPAREARCMCVESALGLTGVVAGTGLVWLGLVRPVVVPPWLLAGSVGAVMAIGFVLKDFVFEWSPWKIHREKNHTQVVFRWKK